MADVHDVAAAVLDATGPESPMKLQKLLYYAQAWHLARYDEPMFAARIEAWRRGPVVPEVYHRHRGRTEVCSWQEGDPRGLSERERSVVRDVVERYGKFSRHELSDMAHDEEPWRAARGGLAESEPSSAPLSNEVMARYFRRLTSDGDEAVAEAVGSARLEGRDVPDDLVATLRSVAAGELSMDEAIAREIEALRRS
ncbi:type II toxin-antitoxin system antitoxin SocA domain-containing protein [Saccharothrix australiensis]|uniref:Putative phage-associated protein n=1 Tax=Saccharothrix australiensis TaxID=2072 RepID=A0A495W7X6_9PSEU|nr:type II toxin-antitoxin system antitoxin SocA domain-containing protein [Saccharothrix australiensis]RKT57579.1 putative phage-associated protein [Saccharothrix australiensis]